MVLKNYSFLRTLYEFTIACFALTLKGPYGLPDAENSMMDGQGLVQEETRDLLGGREVWEAVRSLSEEFVGINDRD